MGGPLANPVAVAAESAFQRFRFGAIADGDIDEADGLILRAPVGSGDAGDTDAHASPCTLSDAAGEGLGNLGADGTMLLNQLWWDPGEVGLQFIGINDGSAEEGTRTAADAGDALGEEATCAAFGYGKRFLFEF